MNGDAPQKHMLSLTFYYLIMHASRVLGKGKTRRHSTDLISIIKFYSQFFKSRLSFPKETPT